MNLKYIFIVIILAVVVGGGILVWQYWLMPKEEPGTPEERTFPQSISFNNEFEVIKINSDSIPIALNPLLHDNKVYFHINPYTAADPRLKYYYYDLASKTTRQINENAYNEVKEKLSNYEAIHGIDYLENLEDYYKNIVLNTSPDAFTRIASSNNYIVWSKYIVGGIDKIYLFDKTTEKVQEIIPTQQFISEAGARLRDKQMFTVAAFGIIDDNILIQTKKCIYLVNVKTFDETKLICDEHFLTNMRIFGNNILITGNDAHRPVGGRVSQGIYMIKI